MKNFNTLFRTLAFLLTIFFVSCSQDEQSVAPQSAKSTALKLNRAARPTAPHGKLEIINATDFKMNGPLICYGSNGTTINTDVVLYQNITILPQTTIVLTDFESAYQQGLSEYDIWEVFDGQPNSFIMTGAEASNTYGLFQNYIDSSSGFFSAWKFFGKDGRMSGKVFDDMGGAIGGGVYREVKYVNGFILNDVYSGGVPIGSAFNNHLIIDLVPFGFLPGNSGVNMTIFASGGVLANGDTQLKITQGNVTR